MELNFIEKFKRKKFKKRKDKQSKREDKKYYFCEKKNYFARNCRSINVMNRRKLNVLQIILVKKKQLKKSKNESKFLKVITNDKYYRVKNIDKLQ